MNSNIRDIGKALVEQAENKPTSARGMVDELFPYIYAASKRMSARAISRWLEEKQQVKLSYTTVSKVLKEADERMLSHFNEMRAIEDELHQRMPFSSPQIAWSDKSITLLFNEDSFEQMVSGRDSDIVLSKTEQGNPERSHTKLIQTIRKDWFELPEAYRDDCKKFVSEDHGLLKDNTTKREVNDATNHKTNG